MICEEISIHNFIEFIFFFEMEHNMLQIFKINILRSQISNFLKMSFL